MRSHRSASNGSSPEVDVRGPVAKEIRELREAYQMSPLVAARLVFVSERTWKDWESGKRSMRRAYWELFKIKAKNAHFLQAFIGDDPVAAATYTRKSN